MPLHDHACENGHRFEMFVTLADLDRSVVCRCGAMAHRVFLQAPMSRVIDVRYTSPIDGRPITTKHARQEDLARSNCVEYDPEMKTDYLRRQRESADAIDRKTDAVVEQEIHAMGARKRERLEAELTHGADIAFERT